MEHVDLLKRVKTILNEHKGDDEVTLITAERVVLDEYIERAIADAVTMLAAKGYRVNVKKVSVSDHGDDAGVGTFLSLIEASSVEWKKRVTHLTPTDSPEFIMSQNDFTKPKANSPIVWWDEARKDLNAAPWDVDKTVVFVFNAKYDKNDGLNANEKETAAVCYMAAALTLGMFGDDSGKQRLSDIATNILQ